MSHASTSNEPVWPSEPKNEGSIKMMKKILAIALCAVLCFSLASCGTPTSGTSQPPSETPSENPTSSPSQDVLSSEEPSAEIKSFHAQASNFIDTLTTVYDGTLSDPEELDNSEEEPNISVKVYSVGDYANLYCYENDLNGELTKVTLYASLKNVDTTEKAKSLGSLQAIVVAMMEPDDDMLTEVDADLDIANSGLTAGTLNFATGSIASYMFFVDDSLSMLIIDPL